MRRLVGALLAVAVLGLAGCDRDGNGGGPDLGIKLDGSPRVPDIEGVATRITRQAITVGGRTYRFDPALKAFSTYTLELEPVVSRQGQLVHVGLDGDTAVWVAGVGAPIGDPPVVVYAGTLVRVTDGRAVMRDGTTFPLGEGSVVEAERGTVQVRLDPRTGRILDLRLT